MGHKRARKAGSRGMAITLTAAKGLESRACNGLAMREEMATPEGWVRPDPPPPCNGLAMREERTAVAAFAREHCDQALQGGDGGAGDDTSREGATAPSRNNGPARSGDAGAGDGNLEVRKCRYRHFVI
jgi:hypothetical protein